MRALIVLQKKVARLKLAGHRIELSGVEAGGHGILMKMLGKVKVRGLDEVDQKKKRPSRWSGSAVRDARGARH